MTPEQTDNLLEFLASANVLNKLEEIGPDVWTAALNDLDYRDAMQAAANLIRTHQWVKISDVRQAVRAIRDARIVAAMPVYEPPPDNESGDEFVIRLRQQLAAAADGQLPPRLDRPVLSGPPHPSVAKVLEGVVHLVPDDEEVAQVKRPGPLGTTCPKCKAPAGRPCKTPGGKERRPHPVRAMAANGQQIDGEAERLEVERRRAVSRRYLAAAPDQHTNHDTEGEAS